MSCKLSPRQVGDVTVVDVFGRIVVGKGSSNLRDGIRDLLAKGQKEILLNITKVERIDAAGLGELTSGFATAANRGGRLKLLNATESARELMRDTGLYKIFEIFDDEAVAVRSFTSPVLTGPFVRRGGVSTEQENA